MSEATEAATTEEDTVVKIEVDKEKYVSTVSASGKKSLRITDNVAETLDGLPIEAVHALGKKFLKEDTAEKYQHLNVGMQRMNIGNRLRKFVASAEEGEDRAGDLADAAGPMHAKASKAREAEQKRKDKEAAEAAKVKAAKAKNKEAKKKD